MLDKRTSRDLATNLQRELKERGWNQSDLARECEIAPARINEILGGKKDPRLGTLTKIARGLGIPVAYLLYPSETALAGAE